MNKEKITTLASNEQITEFVDQHELFMIDCDGVLWNEGMPIEGTIEALHFLRQQGKKIVFVTNNSTSSRPQYVQKFATMMSFETRIEEIYSSSFLAAHYIHHYHPKVKKIYVVGEEGLCAELRSWGFTVVGGPQHKNKEITEKQFTEMEDEHIRSIDAVVCGWDKSFNFYKMCYASLAFQFNPECIFIATNRDSYDKVTPTRNIPVGGGMVAALEAVTERTPTLVGKPSHWFVEKLMEQNGITEKSKIVMIGDRFDTDIQMANNAKINSMLVLTGVSLQHNLEEKKNEHRLPKYVMNSFADLKTKYLKEL